MISQKQKKILAFPYSGYDALICDGAVRSGKTSIMMVAFIDWAMREFSGQRFGVCGKTVDSATKNIIVPYIHMSYAKDRYTLRWRRSEKLLEVKRGAVTNWFEVFGGKDESSQDLIQGRTLAGVLLDECVLMPKSFVNQALARCSVDGARYWFSCNPGNPQHWFFKEWIHGREAKNALYLHFSMEDNPSLSEKTLEKYRRQYSGVFYERYVLGKWVLSEGIVYDMFSREKHVVPAGKLPETVGPYYVSSDYGIQNANVFLLWRRVAGTNKWLCMKESYYSGREEKRQKADDDLLKLLQKMLDDSIVVFDEWGGRIATNELVESIIIDPSAASMIALLRRNGFSVRQANNEVVPGISDVSSMLAQERLLFSDECKHTISEFGLYCWDEKAVERGVDAPMKVNDHAMDAVRYFVKTMNLVKRTETNSYQSVFFR